MASSTRATVPALSLVLLVASAVFLNYVDRGSIAVAAPLLKGELGLSATMFGIAVSAFFWIYAPIQCVMGWLCDRFSVYRLFAVGLALWAVSTTLTGFVGGFTSLLVLRVLLGLGESIAFPGCSKIIARHVPPSKRGLANAAVAVGMALGPVLGTLGGGLIMASYGWRAIFLVFGLVTLLWLAPWYLVTKNMRPDAGGGSHPHFHPSRLLRNRALWATGIGHFAANYGFYFILAWLPLYLVQSRNFSITSMTFLVTATYAAQAVSALFVGWVSDYWVSRGRSEATVRRLTIALGHALLGICIAAIAVTHDYVWLIFWLVITGAAMAVPTVNLHCIAQMFGGPRAAGMWEGVQNAIGNMAGIVGPIVTGMIVDKSGSYLNAFILASVVSIIGALWWVAVVPEIRQAELD